MFDFHYLEVYQKDQKTIAVDELVVGYALGKSKFEEKVLGNQVASIFWGFCNKHDAIFKPIENSPYQQTHEQNFYSLIESSLSQLIRKSKSLSG